MAPGHREDRGGEKVARRNPSRKFFETSGRACHHQNITDMAVGEVRARGVSTSAEHARERQKMLSAGPPPEVPV
jgi:hypothetical protein